MLVSEILRDKGDTEVLTAPPATMISAAALVLSQKGIGVMVVSTDGSTPIGILSERDIVRELGRRGAMVLSMTVEQLMTSKLRTCGHNDTAETVLEVMTEGRFRHMPVVENGKLMGLISLGDVVKARLNELSEQRKDDGA